MPPAAKIATPLAGPFTTTVMPETTMSTPRDPSQPLTIGVLGCANIARQFIRDVAPSTSVRLAAVASRDAQKAAAFAAENRIERSHGSYEALLADPAIDAVYIPLPNSMHAEWAIKAADAGKHILCEKPLALNRGEAEAMFEAAASNGVTLLEAYPWWFQPQTQAMLALIEEGSIGEVRFIQACFGFKLGGAPSNIRLDAGLGGGALLDAGSYPFSLIRLVMGCAPSRVTAVASSGPSGVDISTMATLEYADGRRAQMSCAMDVALHRHATIIGTGGVIETEFLNHTTEGTGHPFGYVPSQLRVRKGPSQTVPFEDVSAPVGSGFRFAAEAFAEMVRAGGTDAAAKAARASIDIAATLEAVQRSVTSGAPVQLRA